MSIFNRRERKPNVGEDSYSEYLKALNDLVSHPIKTDTETPLHSSMFADRVDGPALEIQRKNREIANNNAGRIAMYESRDAMFHASNGNVGLRTPVVGNHGMDRLQQPSLEQGSIEIGSVVYFDLFKRPTELPTPSHTDDQIAS